MEIDGFYSIPRSICPVSRFSGTTCLQTGTASPQQRFLRHDQVAQGTGHKQAMSILVQTAIPHLGESELPFDDAKLVFHLCPDPGLVPVPAALVISQRLVAATLRLGEVSGAWRTIDYGFGDFLPAKDGSIFSRNCSLRVFLRYFSKLAS